MENKNSILPDFLIVGAQKAATSSLFDILNQHSQIYLPPEKEVHFFDYPEKIKKGIGYYAKYFQDAGNAIAIGEASPSYLFFPEVPRQILLILGKGTKIIILLRDPVDRAFSHYRMMYMHGYEKRPLSSVIDENLKSLQFGINFDRVTSYLDRSLYAFQIKNYLELFPTENLKFILFEEDFLLNRKKTILEIQRFLGVREEDISVNIKTFPTVKIRSNQIDKSLNTANPVNQFFKMILPSKKIRMFVKYYLNEINSKPVLINEDFDSLKPMLVRDVFYNDIKETEGLIKRDLSRWYKDY
ncbi:MAG: sulfotransferase domain-containing protein [Bacteroidales bacterium]|nr:sulfotransferase domain-containing protein [Bacteroidales bacterium]MCF8406053.1 sulfotransferase domain-containing protein [Bacteroidales bacterium]